MAQRSWTQDLLFLKDLKDSKEHFLKDFLKGVKGYEGVFPEGFPQGLAQRPWTQDLYFLKDSKDSKEYFLEDFLEGFKGYS